MKTKHLILVTLLILGTLSIHTQLSKSAETCGIPSLQVSLQRTGTSCTAKVKWEVRNKTEDSFRDYSGDCTEGNPDVAVSPTSSQTATCSSWNIPPKQTGPHTARLSWCGASIELQYGGSCDFSTRATCETDGTCWWDDGNEDCKICETEDIEDCADYPTQVWGVVGGACPVCIRNPCQVDEGPCQISSFGLSTSCTKCDAFGAKVDECFDYDTASSCDCDPCEAGLLGGQKCDWGAGPTVEKYIEIDLADSYGDATGGNLQLKCGGAEVSGQLVSTSGDRAKFKITKEQLEELFDAGCWYS